MTNEDADSDEGTTHAPNTGFQKRACCLERNTRKRNRIFLVKQRAAALAVPTNDKADGGGDEEGEAIQYPFFTEGSTALLKARYEIAKDSVAEAAMRLGRTEEQRRDDPDEDLDAEINWALENANSFAL